MQREKIVLVGAGSAMFTRGLVADLIRRGWDMDLGLVDTDPEGLRVAEGLTRKMIEARRAPIRLDAATDVRAVLQDATAVICTIGVGGRRAWEKDVFIPRKYGIYQPVGDSVMPGGTSRALRMIPPMVEVAKAVLDLCPRALFFNYGNPMAAVCRGVRKATGAPVVGLCHGVHHVAHGLARALDVPFEDLRYTALGINHLTWFTELRVRGHDALPRLREIAREKLALAQSLAENMGKRFAEAGTAEREPKLEDLNPFCWKLFLVFGAYPAVGDRHVTEFFPNLCPGGLYYGKKLGLETFSLEQTTAWGDKIFEEMRATALSAQPLDAAYFDQFSGEHEQVVDIIDGIRADSGRVYSVNLPNQGQVPNFPPAAVIECPAVATGSGLKPLAHGPVSSGLAGALATRFGWVETVAEAAIEGSREKFIQALILDGCVPSVDVAEKLAAELLEAHAPYLPRFAKK